MVYFQPHFVFKPHTCAYFVGLSYLHVCLLSLLYKDGGNFGNVEQWLWGMDTGVINTWM